MLNDSDVGQIYLPLVAINELPDYLKNKKSKYENFS